MVGGKPGIRCLREGGEGIGMAKSANQKLKLLHIVRILEENTDEEHCISTQELIRELAKYDIAAERKSIYSDMEQLERFGYDIVYVKAKSGGGYYLAGRRFELPELKLLVDAVQSSRFLTLKKSRELIRKIGQLAGKHGAKQLNRQVYVAGRIKTENESIYYTVDKIHRAIQENCQIGFQYMEWTPEKELRPRKDGAKYRISPWALTCKDENYYLVAYDGAAGKIKHYRVDKIGGVQLEEGLAREGGDSFLRFDIGAYANKTFGMFGGEEAVVTLEIPEWMVGIVLDRFGRETDIRRVECVEKKVSRCQSKTGKEAEKETEMKTETATAKEAARFHARIEVAVSRPFFGWLTGLGADVKILSPADVAERYRNYLGEILENYGTGKADGEKNRQDGQTEDSKREEGRRWI